MEKKPGSEINPDKSWKWATASLVIGVIMVALLCLLVTILVGGTRGPIPIPLTLFVEVGGFPLGLAAVTTAVIAIARARKQKSRVSWMAIVGLVLGGIGLFWSLFAFWVNVIVQYG